MLIEEGPQVRPAWVEVAEYVRRDMSARAALALLGDRVVARAYEWTTLFVRDKPRSYSTGCTVTVAFMSSNMRIGPTYGFRTEDIANEWIRQRYPHLVRHNYAGTDAANLVAIWEPLDRHGAPKSTLLAATPDAGKADNEGGE